MIIISDHRWVPQGYEEGRGGSSTSPTHYVQRWPSQRDGRGLCGFSQAVASFNICATTNRPGNSMGLVATVLLEIAARGRIINIARKVMKFYNHRKRRDIVYSASLLCEWFYCIEVNDTSRSHGIGGFDDGAHDLFEDFSFFRRELFLKHDAEWWSPRVR